LYRLKKQNGNVITAFREHVRKTPNRVIFFYEDQSWTFQQLEDWTNKVANAFTSQGFKAGDEVALFMESRPEFVGLWLGLSKVGIIAALINTNQRSQTLIHSIVSIKCKALIFGRELSSGEKITS
jgi:solute carrier family 27 fatty acid transporter 1/4